MIRNFKIVKVDYKYCDYLRKFDDKVSYNASIKELRPFIGILFVVNNCDYYAPLSSPKDKHLHMKNNIDIIKINDGKLGAVNFNNMIPVSPNNYEIIDINKVPENINELKRQQLLKDQLLWLNKNYNRIIIKALKLYDLYTCGRLVKRIKDRCCNFPLLEEKCKEYNNIEQKV